jgi:hypothetical protein
MLKITVIFSLLTGGLIAHETIKANGYELAALLAAIGSIVITWLYAIQKES